MIDDAYLQTFKNLRFRAWARTKMVHTLPRVYGEMCRICWEDAEKAMLRKIKLEYHMMELPRFNASEHQNIVAAVNDDRTPIETFTDTKLRRWRLQRKQGQIAMHLRHYDCKANEETIVRVTKKFLSECREKSE